MTALKDETGNIYERLTVINRAPNKGIVPAWNCACICGNKTIASGENLRAGHVRSCGCLAKELSSKRAATHSMTGTPEHLTWININRRCHGTDPNKLRLYRDRGISVCDKWRHNFDAFFADMGYRPSANHSIDRINNDGNYEPGNCRWATVKEQANNRRTNLNITHNGVTKTLKQWSEHLGIHRCTLKYRYDSGEFGHG